MERENANQQMVNDFLAMVERLYFENYSLKQILQRTVLSDGSPAIPNWQSLLREFLSNDLLRDVIHQKKFAPLFDQLRVATQAVAVDEVLRSIEKASSED